MRSFVVKCNKYHNKRLWNPAKTDSQNESTLNSGRTRILMNDDSMPSLELSERTYHGIFSSQAPGAHLRGNEEFIIHNMAFVAFTYNTLQLEKHL